MTRSRHFKLLLNLKINFSQCWFLWLDQLLFVDFIYLSSLRLFFFFFLLTCFQIQSKYLYHRSIFFQDRTRPRLPELFWHIMWLKNYARSLVKRKWKIRRPISKHIHVILTGSEHHCAKNIGNASILCSTYILSICYQNILQP